MKRDRDGGDFYYSVSDIKWQDVGVIWRHFKDAEFRKLSTMGDSELLFTAHENPRVFINVVIMKENNFIHVLFTDRRRGDADYVRVREAMKKFCPEFLEKYKVFL